MPLARINPTHGPILAQKLAERVLGELSAATPIVFEDVTAVSSWRMSLARKTICQ